MGDWVEVPADKFASALSDILKEVGMSVSNACEKAVSQSTRKGVKTVKKYAGKGGKHTWSKEYVGGFSSRVKKAGGSTTGEIGNRAKPGLVHLLEKGHNTLTGRRTNAYPHLDPAFKEIKDDFIERMQKSVGEALRR